MKRKHRPNRLPEDLQYGKPTGTAGWQAGLRMREQHQPENRWTLALLEVQPDHQVLEIGCGSGVLLEPLVQQVTQGTVVGLDRSEVMVKMVQVHLAESLQGGRLQVLCADAAHLPFPNACFDRVANVHGLYFWSDPFKVLQECHRVLRPGGQMVLTFLAKASWPRQGQGAKCQVFEVSEVLELFHGAGFTHVKAELGPQGVRESAVVGWRS